VSVRNQVAILAERVGKVRWQAESRGTETRRQGSEFPGPTREISTDAAHP
jgi:hypothetical protein